MLRISEMTKKIEHKGVSNRVLRQLGWVNATSKRDNPRNSEIQLREVGELLRLRRDPARFIGRVFQSNNEMWVERCSKIIQERR